MKGAEHMKHLIEMKRKLVECAEAQMEDLCAVDTEELGAVIDMIKDLEEGIFYCIMGHHQLEKDEASVTTMQHCCHCDGIEEVDFIEEETPFMKKEHMAAIYDYHNHEGHSHAKRKAYLEAKENKKDKIIQMKELEEYMKELSTDVTEMIKDASLEERQLLEKRLQALAAKVSSIDEK